MKVIPFLKWAGGKRWLISSMPELFDLNFHRYIEPFVGGGAVFFHVCPDFAILSDKNKQLIDAYRAIKLDWKSVFKYLEVHKKLHSDQYYYEIRSSEYDNIFEKSAQFIYLNRTCWNGLYRVNLNGRFNVPRGTRNTVIFENDNFEGVSAALKNTELLNSDFETVIDSSEEGDFLFIDPPYTANHNKNGFLKYNENIFSWEDQVRLSECVKRAFARGVKMVLTNADHESVLSLYSDIFKVFSVPRTSSLSGKSKYRGKVTELIVLGNVEITQISFSNN